MVSYTFYRSFSKTMIEVLILVVVDDGLVPDDNLVLVNRTDVLILVVVDDGLVLVRTAMLITAP